MAPSVVDVAAHPSMQPVFRAVSGSVVADEVLAGEDPDDLAAAAKNCGDGRPSFAAEIFCLLLISLSMAASLGEPLTELVSNVDLPAPVAMMLRSAAAKYAAVVPPLMESLQSEAGQRVSPFMDSIGSVAAKHAASLPPLPPLPSSIAMYLEAMPPLSPSLISSLMPIILLPLLLASLSRLVISREERGGYTLLVLVLAASFLQAISMSLCGQPGAAAAPAPEPSYYSYLSDYIPGFSSYIAPLIA
jgi:hypothetical protein